MNAFVKRENRNLPFSYIDIFFLLLAGLVLSFGIYFFSEAKDERDAAVYRVGLSTYVDEALAEAVPEAGETLYGEDGDKIGVILTVETEKIGSAFLVRVECVMEGEMPEQGQEIRIETGSCIRPMWVYSVEAAANSEEGRDWS